MEENIKNLEEIINLCKEELDKNDLNISAVLDFIDLKSLRNLLKKYKEQKGEIKLLKDQIEYVINELGDIIDEQKERIKDLEEENKKIIQGKFREVADKNSYIKDMYIPKSKIKEKIEELKNKSEKESFYISFWVIQSKIRVLEELLNTKM